MQAVVLAAGEGARMGPFTASEPKVMIPVGNRPILGYVVEALASAGVEDIVMVVGYRRERIMSFFQDGKGWGARIAYVVQGKQLGTAHAVWEARDRLKGPFLVVNGSNVIDERVVEDLLGGKRPAMAITRSETPTRYGSVVVKDGLVEAIVERPAERISDYINTGLYAFDESVFADLEAIVKAGRTDMPSLVQALADRRAMNVVETKGVWTDAMYPWDLLKVNGEVLKSVTDQKAGTIERGVAIRGSVHISEGTTIRSGSYLQGPCILGKGCEVGPNAVVLPSTSLGANVRVGPFSVVQNSILMDDASIGPGCTLQNSVVGMGARLAAGALGAAGPADVYIEGEWHRVPDAGVFIGEDTSLGAGVVLTPGVLVGARVKVAPQATLRGSIPNGAVVV